MSSGMSISNLSISDAEDLLSLLRENIRTLEIHILRERKIKNDLSSHLKDPSTFDFNYESLRKFDSCRQFSVSIKDYKKAYFESEIAECFEKGSRFLRGYINSEDSKKSVRVPGYIVDITRSVGDEYTERHYRKSGGDDNYANYIDAVADDLPLVEKIVGMTKELEMLNNEDIFGDVDMFNIFFDWFLEAACSKNYIIFVSKKNIVTSCTTYPDNLTEDTLSDREDTLSKILFSFFIEEDKSEEFLYRIEEYIYYHLGDRIKAFFTKDKTEFIKFI